MGEIAEMMLDGILDEQTGEYIGPGVGYPRTREKGYYNSMNHNHSNGAKARGVVKWLNSKNIPKNKWTELMTEFLIKKQPQLNMNNYKSDRSMMVHISGHCFHKFTGWILNKIK